VTVKLEWKPAGPVSLVADRLNFPKPLSAGPALYRFTFTGPNGVRVYVGETSNLLRRAAHYRLGSPGQRTNKWVYDLMHKHLHGDGTIEIAVALAGELVVNGEAQPLDLRRKMTRLLAENAALHAIPPDQILNLPGVGEL
jgi:hypothetical protein